MSGLTDAERESLDAHVLRIHCAPSEKHLDKSRDRLHAELEAIIAARVSDAVAAFRTEAVDAIEAEFAAWDGLGDLKAPHPPNSAAWLVERSYASTARIVRDLNT